MFMQPNEWRKSFQNKTESELEALIPPPGLPPVILKSWHRDREQALVLARLSKAEPDQPEDEESDEEEQSFSKQKIAVDAAMSALENDASDREAPALPPAPPLEIPKGSVADLLEHQIGTCSALIANIADYVARNDSRPDICFPFMDRIASLLSSSATAGRVVGQLRGIASETKQTFITEKGGKGAGGVPQT
jgi:hypothetical protein